jgi:hypothetical protein
VRFVALQAKVVAVEFILQALKLVADSLNAKCVASTLADTSLTACVFWCL